MDNFKIKVLLCLIALFTLAFMLLGGCNSETPGDLGPSIESSSSSEAEAFQKVTFTYVSKFTISIRNFIVIDHFSNFAYHLTDQCDAHYEVSGLSNLTTGQVEIQSSNLIDQYCYLYTVTNRIENLSPSQVHPKTTFTSVIKVIVPVSNFILIDYFNDLIYYLTSQYNAYYAVIGLSNLITGQTKVQSSNLIAESGLYAVTNRIGNWPPSQIQPNTTFTYLLTDTYVTNATIPIKNYILTNNEISSYNNPDNINRIYQTNNENGISNVLVFWTVTNYSQVAYHLTDQYNIHYQVSVLSNTATGQVDVQSSNLIIQHGVYTVTNSIQPLSNNVIVTNIDIINYRTDLPHPDHITNWTYSTSLSKRWNRDSLLYIMSGPEVNRRFWAAYKNGRRISPAAKVMFDTHYYVSNIEYSFAGLNQNSYRRNEMLIQVQYWDSDTWSTLASHSTTLSGTTTGSVSVHNLIKGYRMVMNSTNLVFDIANVGQRYYYFRPTFVTHSESDIKGLINRHRDELILDLENRRVSIVGDGVDEGLPFIHYDETDFY